MTRTADLDAARELALFAINDYDLYRQRILPIIANLQRKMKRGTYDASLAPKIWQYAADDAAKRYTREYGGSFDKPTRTAAAIEIASHYQDALTEIAA